MTNVTEIVLAFWLTNAHNKGMTRNENLAAANAILQVWLNETDLDASGRVASTYNDFVANTGVSARIVDSEGEKFPVRALYVENAYIGLVNQFFDRNRINEWFKAVS